MDLQPVPHSTKQCFQSTQNEPDKVTHPFNSSTWDGEVEDDHESEASLSYKTDSASTDRQLDQEFTLN